jgi:hypothetical protein
LLSGQHAFIIYFAYGSSKSVEFRHIKFSNEFSKGGQRVSNAFQ